MAPRRASDAIKGTAATEPENEQDATRAEGQDEAQGDKPDAQATPPLDETPSENPADATAGAGDPTPAPVTAPQADPEDVPEADELDEDVEVVVTADLFQFIDPESGSHTAARKGETVKVSREIAQRGISLKAVTIKD